MGTQGAIVAGARLVQGVLKGQFFTQLGREINHLIEQGKIPEDYVEKKYGFESFAELMQFIDEQPLTADRFIAIKAMFFATNAINVEDGEKILNYQLFKLSMSLSSSQLLLLKLSYDLYQQNHWPDPGANSSAQGWIKLLAEKSGHGVQTLIRRDEKVLVEFGFISDRLHPDQSGIDVRNARLTDLGLKFCQNIENFGIIN